MKLTALEVKDQNLVHDSAWWVNSRGPSRPPSLPVVHPGHLPAIREPCWVDVLALVD